MDGYYFTLEIGNTIRMRGEYETFVIIGASQKGLYTAIKTVSVSDPTLWEKV